MADFSVAVTLNAGTPTQTVKTFFSYTYRDKPRGFTFQIAPSAAPTQGTLLVEARLTEDAAFVPARLEADDADTIDLTAASRIYELPFFPHDVRFTLQNPQGGLSLDVVLVAVQ